MLTRSGLDSTSIEAASRAYSVVRHVVARGGPLEAIERVGLLTVPAKLRQFCLLTHIDDTQFQLAESVLSKLGLYCGPCRVTFEYDIDVDAPSDVKAAFKSYEVRNPLTGLGVARTRVTFGSGPLGTILGYPQCCSEMDESTKKEDRATALRLLIESKKGDFAAVKNALLTCANIPESATEGRKAWDLRFDRTRDLFPFALHTACDNCIDRGMESPSGHISERHEALVRAAAPELYQAVLRTRELLQRTPISGASRETRARVPTGERDEPKWIYHEGAHHPPDFE